MKKLPYFLFLVLVWLGVSCATQRLGQPQEVYENYPITEEVAVDSTQAIVSLISKYRAGLEAKMGKVIGYSSMYMPKKKPESLLSNMVADFTHQLGKKYCTDNNLPYTVDASIINIGGLRKAMPEGEVTLGDIYEISPFENKLLIVAMYGKDLRKLLDHITRSGGEGIGNIILKAAKDTGKLKEVFIDDKALDDETLYRIISIDYLVNGGDGMVAFSKNIEIVDMGIKSRDALLEYVKEEYKANRPLVSQLDNRISYE